MNPAALRRTWPTCGPAAIVIVNADEFTTRGLAKAGYDAATRWRDGSLAVVRRARGAAHVADASAALKGLDVSRKEGERAKNMFALGLL